MSDTNALHDDESHESILSAEEARVLGSLMEKQMTTPAYYPLTLNALVAACNQKSSREPVMNLTSGQVGKIVSGLRGRGYITARMDTRADRFEQHLSRKFGLSAKERAVMCVLMLRAAQTANEIRLHTSRMVEFDDAEDLQDTIRHLMERDEPLVMRLPRMAGQREERFMHLLCGEPDVGAEAPAPGAPDDVLAMAGRVAQLEQAVAELQEEFSRMRNCCGLLQLADPGCDSDSPD